MGGRFHIFMISVLNISHPFILQVLRTAAAAVIVIITATIAVTAAIRPVALPRFDFLLTQMTKRTRQLIIRLPLLTTRLLDLGERLDHAFINLSTVIAAMFVFAHVYHLFFRGVSRTFTVYVCPPWLDTTNF